MILVEHIICIYMIDYYLWYDDRDSYLKINGAINANILVTNDNKNLCCMRHLYSDTNNMPNHINNNIYNVM